MMLCPYCATTIPAVMEAEIAWADSDCPSDCDGELGLQAHCPECGRLFWQRTVEVGYDVREFLALGVFPRKPVEWSGDNMDPDDMTGGVVRVAGGDGVEFAARVSRDVLHATWEGRKDPETAAMLVDLGADADLIAHMLDELARACAQGCYINPLRYLVRRLHANGFIDEAARVNGMLPEFSRV